MISNHSEKFNIIVVINIKELRVIITPSKNVALISPLWSFKLFHVFEYRTPISDFRIFKYFEFVLSRYKPTD